LYVGRSTGGMGEGWTMIKTKTAFLECQNSNTAIFIFKKQLVHSFITLSTRHATVIYT